MPEHNTAENILNTIMETLSDGTPKKKSVSFFEEENTVSAQMNRLFGRQKSIHKVLGGGKSADVLLWRNKKISSGVLVGATAIWVLFEWLNYNFMALTCLALVIGMLVQFVWTNASGLLNRSPSQVPRIVLPEELFINIAVGVGTEVNRFLGFLQDVATGRNLKQFLIVLVGLWAAAIIGTWFNFLTVVYVAIIECWNCWHSVSFLSRNQIYSKALWLLILCQCYMKGMKTRWTTLYIVFSDNSRTNTRSWIEGYSAEFRRENFGERNSNKPGTVISLLKLDDVGLLSCSAPVIDRPLGTKQMHCYVAM